MNTYSVILDDMIEGTVRAEIEPEVGDWASARHYNCYGDVCWSEGVITDVLENHDE